MPSDPSKASQQPRVWPFAESPPDRDEARGPVNARKGTILGPENGTSTNGGLPASALGNAAGLPQHQQHAQQPHRQCRSPGPY